MAPDANGRGSGGSDRDRFDGGDPDGGDLVRLAEVTAALTGRWPEHRIAPSLERITALLDLLGTPQRAAPVVHVAGTNGKTSTARMIESILRATGLHTGLFTSPHLHSVRERIRFDGDPIEIGRFLAAYDDIAPYLDLVDERSARAGGPPLSFFEVLTGMAFAAFADAPVDVVVLEVGMGGSWDSTNVVDAPVAVITPIGLDHQQYLGDTLAEIAAEKAGILRPDQIAILGEQPTDAMETILGVALAHGTRVAQASIDFSVTDRDVAVGGQVVSISGLAGYYTDLVLPLHGAHQAANAAMAVAAVEAFFGGGSVALDPTVVARGLGEVRTPGRLEVVRRGPTVLVDAAHNVAGATALAEAVRDAFTFTHLVAVVAMLDDKDASGFLGALEPVVHEVVVTRSTSPRALDVETLADIARDVFDEDVVHTEPTLVAALERAVELLDLAVPDVEAGGVGVLVTGSVVTVAEARAMFGHADDL